MYTVTGFFFLLRTIPCCTHGSGMQPWEVNKIPGNLLLRSSRKTKSFLSTLIHSLSYIHTFDMHTVANNNFSFILSCMHTLIVLDLKTATHFHISKSPSMIQTVNFIFCALKKCWLLPASISLLFVFCVMVNKRIIFSL